MNPDELRETASSAEVIRLVYDEDADTVNTLLVAARNLAKVIEWAEDGIGLLGDGARGSLNVALAIARGETNERGER